MKIAIGGTRQKFLTLTQARVFKAWINAFVSVQPKNDTTIVSGDSPGGGPDVWAIQAVHLFGMLCKTFPIKDAGKVKTMTEFAKLAFARNQQVVDYSDALVMFWDGKSKGTADTIKRAQVAGKPLWVVQTPQDFIHLMATFPYDLDAKKLEAELAKV